jgi:hypothetical protein
MIFVSSIELLAGVVEDIEVPLLDVGPLPHWLEAVSAVVVEVDCHPLGIVLACPTALLHPYPVFIIIVDRSNSMSLFSLLRR